MPPLPVGLQLVALNTPEEGGVSWNMTGTLGVIFVPLLVSATVAVHVVIKLSSTSRELQLIVVDVVLSSAVRPNVLELSVWSVSPP